MKNPDPKVVYLDFCELCGKGIENEYNIAYPHGHHGEPVQCLGCYTQNLDSVYENLKGD